MLRLYRPPEPDSFAERVTAAHAAIEAVVTVGGCLEDKHFPDHWSEYK